MNAKYRTDGPDYDLICELLHWDPRCKAVQVRRSADPNVLYVTGTLLKPEEWLRLHDIRGRQLDDGAIVAILPRRSASMAKAEAEALWGLELPTYSVVVLEPGWHHLHDGSPVIERKCGHEHKSIAAAERCRRSLTRGDWEGWVNAAWRDAEVRRSDGSRLSDDEANVLLKLEGGR